MSMAQQNGENESPVPVHTTQEWGTDFQIIKLHMKHWMWTNEWRSTVNMVAERIPTINILISNISTNVNKHKFLW